MLDRRTRFEDSAGRTYRLIRSLGRGGFGSVFLAEVRSPDGLVQHLAVKVLHPEFAGRPEMVARTRDEARLLGRLTHDHVVRVHGIVELAGRTAILLEYVEGVDVATLLSDARARGEVGLPPRVVAAVGACTASALHAAYHTVSPLTGQPLRIVHRDLKPSNLLVSRFGVVKVVDFGVARGDVPREARTRSLLFGTERLMAPERFLLGRSGPASDIYALGITSWEMLTGRWFERLPLAERPYAVHLEAALAVLERRPDLGAAARGFAELLRACLAREEEARPAAHELEHLFDDLAQVAPGPDLRRFARERVPPLLEGAPGGASAPSAGEGAGSREPAVDPPHILPIETLDSPPRGEAPPLLSPETRPTPSGPPPGGGEVPAPQAATPDRPPSTLVPPGDGERSAPPPPAASPRPSPEEPDTLSRPWRRGRKWGWALLLLAAGGGAWALRERSPGTTLEGAPAVAGSPSPASGSEVRSGPEAPLPGRASGPAGQAPAGGRGALGQPPSEGRPAAPERGEADRERPAADAGRTSGGSDAPPAPAAPSPAASGPGADEADPGADSPRPGGIAGFDPPPPAPVAPDEGGAAREAPAPLVHLKVLADPREGVLSVAGRRVPVGEIVDLPPGRYTFFFQGSGWSSTCQREVRPGMSRIKFSYRDRKKERRCQLD